MFFSLSHILVNFTEPLVISWKRCVSFFSLRQINARKTKNTSNKELLIKFPGKYTLGDDSIHLSFFISQIHVRRHEIMHWSSLLQRNRNFIAQTMTSMLRSGFCSNTSQYKDAGSIFVKIMKSSISSAYSSTLKVWKVSWVFQGLILSNRMYAYLKVTYWKGLICLCFPRREMGCSQLPSSPYSICKRSDNYTLKVLD